MTKSSSARTLCSAAPVTFPVAYYTSYADRRQASPREMEEIAWVLRTDSKRNEIGFVRASKQSDRERPALIEESATGPVRLHYNEAWRRPTRFPTASWFSH